MSVTEVQTPLPVPPTGHDDTITIHPFNPESGHYEPSLKNVPLNVNALAGLVAAAFLAVTAAARPWFYYFVFANTGAAVGTVTLTEPGGNTLIVEIPANLTVTLPSNPDAPIFVSRTAGNITIVSDVATVQVTATYVMK